MSLWLLAVCGSWAWSGWYCAAVRENASRTSSRKPRLARSMKMVPGWDIA